MNTLIAIASREMGIKAVPGQQDNDYIKQFAQEAGFEKIASPREEWSSLFLNWVSKRAGFERSRKLNARSWLNVGIAVEHPLPGDIVVFWLKSMRSKLGHVGIFNGFSSNHQRVYVLGGNRRNAVCIEDFPFQQVLGFRRLRPQGEIAIPQTVLKPGSYGPAVHLLQQALQLINYYPHPITGLYAERTEEAISLLQSTSEHLEPSGIFDIETRYYLSGLLIKIHE